MLVQHGDSVQSVPICRLCYERKNLMGIFDIIFSPLKYALEGLNAVCGYYAVSILVFTIIVNLCLIPLTIKQQKSTAKQARLKPKLDALKEKYGNDKMKYQTAMQELYQRENVSMTGGCLPMMIRMVLLMGVYSAIRSMIYNADGTTKIAAGTPAYSLFGIDLAQTPQFSTDIINKFDWIWLIPILSGVAALVSSMISTAQQKHNNPQADMAGGSMKMMMLIMPIFSIWIAFTVPAAVGLYWIYSNLVNMVIMLVVNHVYAPNKLLAKETVKAGYKRRQLENEKIKKSAENPAD